MASPSSSTPPKFRRLPRKHVAPPTTPIDLKGPVAAPSAPSTSIATILIPIVGSILVGGALAVALDRASYMLLSIPMMLVSGSASVYNYQRSHRIFRERTANRQRDYAAYLAAKRLELSELRDRQRTASLVPHPPVEECRRRAEARDERLWERLPEHADFLTVRLGVGSVVSTYLLKAPSPQYGTLELDEELRGAEKLAEEFRTAVGCAVTLPLLDVGSSGVIGNAAETRAMMRAMVLQIAAHHSPAEVKLVAVYPEALGGEWDWLRWLPHTWSNDRRRRYLASTSQDAVSLLNELAVEIRHRQLQSSDPTSSHRHIPAFVCILADAHLAEGPSGPRLAPALQLLRTHGRSVGVYSLFLDDYGERAGAVIDLSGGISRLELVGPPRQESVFQADTISVAAAEAFARTLAPLRPPASDATDVPNRVTLMELLGTERVEDLQVADRWKHSAPFESLAVPIGLRAGGEPLYLDVHERGHGPHGLAAGATGSGKSELLQTLIASLAVHFDPEEVAFVLIDYKGGGMANAFRDLPHQIGIITNLGGNLTSRALAAFRAENRRRQRIFDTVGVTNLDDYQRRKREGAPLEPLAHVIIIADEFAELKQTQPEFMSELISLVRIGRSLGMHLLLATQKPGGIVTDQILGNTRYRLCLRVAQAEDSMEMLRVPHAAAIRLPGRGYCQVGMNEVFEVFQAGFSGAPYDPAGGANVNRYDIRRVSISGERQSLSGEIGRAKSSRRSSQLETVVTYLGKIAAAEKRKRLNTFWLPALPDQLSLSEVVGERDWGWNGRGWRKGSGELSPVIGLADDPATQTQPLARVPLDREGHCIIYGLPGSGKTVFLQTLLISLAHDFPPSDVHIYVLDFGSRLLKNFESLPHVGAVLVPDDSERISRLFQLLQRELDHRKDVLAGVGTHAAYRVHRQGAPPAIIVLLDNYQEFASACPQHLDGFIRVVREGANLGVHLVFTSSSQSGVPMKIAGSIPFAVALEQKEPMDYRSVVGRTPVLPEAGIRGRGLIKATPPLEFQVALPAHGSSDGERTESIRSLVVQMQTAWTGRSAPSVVRLPERIGLASLLTDFQSVGDGMEVPLGVDYDTLANVSVPLSDGPGFLITGPPEVGKTTLLQSWLVALAATQPPERLQLFPIGLGSGWLREFSALPHTASYIDDDEKFAEVVDRLRLLLAERRAQVANSGDHLSPAYPTIVVAIDDLGALRASTKDASRTALEALIRRSRGLAFHVIATASSADIQIASDIAKALRDGQSGFVLGSSDATDLNVLSLRLPAGQAGRTLTPGRGYLAKRGRGRLLQTASLYIEGDALKTWVTRIRSRYAATARADGA